MDFFPPQIIRHSEEMDADIIVMGSRGHGMLADVTMGSTSRRVLRRTGPFRSGGQFRGAMTEPLKL